MTDPEVKQGSDEWHQMRLGKVTASRIQDVMATIASGKPAATRAKYMAELVAERMTGKPYQGFRSRSMDRGNEVEDQARATYEMLTGNRVHEVSFVPHPVIPMAGASPDGLIGCEGGLELKCPDTHTHLATLTGATIERGYRFQMDFGMACTGAEWWDFVSFDPRLPDHLAIYRKRFVRDELRIVAIEREIRKFLAETDQLIETLNQQFPGGTA